MSSSVSTGMGIGRSTGVCAASGAALAVGDRYVATLVDRPGEQVPVRLDYSVEAWNGGARPCPPDRLIGSWRTSMRASAAESKQLLSDDELVELFEEMAGATEPKHLAFRYVLALMLIRRRMLRLVGERRHDGSSTLLVRPKLPPGGVANLTGPEGDPMEVTDPGLDEATINDVIEQLGQVLGGPGASTAGTA
jgi:hypothetical protein